MIEIDTVITKYNIANLQDNKFGKNNLIWVKSQVDYFNSNFTSTKAYNQFIATIQHWYYNYYFKRYLKFGNHREYTETILDLSLANTYKFLETYNKRIRAVLYYRGESIDRIPVYNVDVNTLDISLGRILSIKKSISYKLKTKPQSPEEEFSFIFQAYIGGLEKYTRHITEVFRFDTETQKLDDLSKEEYKKVSEKYGLLSL